MQLAEFHFETTDKGELFFPWATLMIAGAPWAFRVPSAEDRERLSRLVRHANHALWVILVPGLCIGIPMGRGQAAIMVSIVVPLAVYSVCVITQTRHLKRVSMVESLGCYAVKIGPQPLVQQVVFASLLLLAFVWFQITSFAALVCLGFFGINGAMAGCALWLSRT